MIKKFVAVEFDDRTSITGSFFCEPASPLYEQGQTLLELLNCSRRYLPMEDSAKRVLFIQKRAVVIVRATTTELEINSAYATIIPVRVELLSGDSMEGNVYQDLPSSHPRLSDYLNFSRQFFPLQLEGVDCFINTDMVKFVYQA
ncbi:MAG: hypothetical protein ACOC0K_01700 [bacterium]